MKTAFWLLLAFNIWHNSIRGVWNFSVRDALNMNSNIMPLAQSIDPTIREYKPYDGAFSYAMAVDPLLLGDTAWKYIDAPAYRCKRVLYPLLSYALALGEPTRLPYTMLLVNVAAWFLTGWVAWKTAALLKIPGIPLVIGCMATTGLTFTVFRSLTEPLAVAFAFMGCYFWESGKPWKAVMAFTLAGLAREVALFVPLNIIFYEAAFRRQRAFLSTKLLWSFVPLAAWSAYLKWRLPVTRDYNEAQWIQVPFIGFFQWAYKAFETCVTSTDLQRTLSISIVIVVLTVLLVICFLKAPSIWGWLALSQALFCYIVRGYEIWNFHAGSARVIILLMIFSSVYFLTLSKQDRPVS